MQEKIKLLKTALGNFWPNGSEHLFSCPKCNHHKKKLSINVDKDVFKCWICDYSGTSITQLIRKYAPSYYADWRQLSGEVDLSKYEKIFSNFEEVVEQEVELPQNFQTLTGRKTNTKKKPLEYLYSRGLTDRDILVWKMGFCDYGEYQNRIVIPSFSMTGKVNYFVTRSYNEDWIKYKNPQVSKDIIFNDLNIDWGDDIVLVEGVFDAAKCVNSIPILGSVIREDSKLFQKICIKRPDIYLALDEDAKEKQFLLAKKLKEHGLKVYNVDIFPFKDVGDMTRKDFSIRKQNAALVSELDYLKYKLNF